jgi:gliotoxin/aspirochlorine biosynthesis thioredoxin reductase
VSGNNSESIHLLILARMALQYAPRVTIYTNGHTQIHEAVEKDLNAAASRVSQHGSERRIRLDARHISSLSLVSPSTASSASPSPVRITFADDSAEIEGFVLHRTRAEPSNRLACMLGLDLVPSGEVAVSWKVRQTSLRGVFAAGDAAGFMKNVAAAQLDGTCAAWGLAIQLEADLLGHEDVDFADR